MGRRSKHCWKMGNQPTRDSFLKPETTPDVFNPPTYDPMYGFPNGRKERVMKVTEDEMEAAGVPKAFRGYCGHLYIDYLQCRKDKYPWVARCPMKSMFGMI